MMKTFKNSSLKHFKTSKEIHNKKNFKIKLHNENIEPKTEKTINKSILTEEIYLRKKMLFIYNLQKNFKKNNDKKIYISDKNSKSAKLLNYSGNKKVFNIKNHNYKIRNNKKIILGSTEKKQKILKNKKIFKGKSQNNLRARNYIKNNLNIYEKKSHSFDNLNKNIFVINKNNHKKESCIYIKVNKKNDNKNLFSRHMNTEKEKNNIKIKKQNTKFECKTIGNDQRKDNHKFKTNNKIKAIIKPNKTFNIFLDKEYQERFNKKINVIKIDSPNSNKLRKYNSILMKKNNYNLNTLTSTLSSASTNNSNHSNNRDWVYRLYNEEMNKKKLENKIITSIRKSLLTNISYVEKKKKEEKQKEISKYAQYEEYKNFNHKNNFINNLFLSNKEQRKNFQVKKKLCLNIEQNLNKNKTKKQNKKLNSKLKNKTKNNYYLCNDELINEEDEEKEIDKE